MMKGEGSQLFQKKDEDMSVLEKYIRNAGVNMAKQAAKFKDNKAGEEKKMLRERQRTLLKKRNQRTMMQDTVNSKTMSRLDSLASTGSNGLSMTGSDLSQANSRISADGSISENNPILEKMKKEGIAYSAKDPAHAVVMHIADWVCGAHPNENVPHPHKFMEKGTADAMAEYQSQMKMEVLEGNPDCLCPVSVWFWEKDRCYPSSEEVDMFAMEVLVVAVDPSGESGVLIELNVYIMKDHVSGFTLDGVSELDQCHIDPKWAVRAAAKAVEIGTEGYAVDWDDLDSPMSRNADSPNASPKQKAVLKVDLEDDSNGIETTVLSTDVRGTEKAVINDSEFTLTSDAGSAKSETTSQTIGVGPHSSSNGVAVNGDSDSGTLKKEDSALLPDKSRRISRLETLPDAPMPPLPTSEGLTIPPIKALPDAVDLEANPASITEAATAAPEVSEPAAATEVTGAGEDPSATTAGDSADGAAPNPDAAAPTPGIAAPEQESAMEVEATEPAVEV